MANPQKAKGDRFEREAVQVLLALGAESGLPLRSNPMRMLGAGRAEDVGDLHVFPHVAIQVKAWAASRLGVALVTASGDAAVQATNAGLPLGLGMVVIPRTQTGGAVRWMAAAQTWPVDPPGDLPEFKLVSRMVPWLRDDAGPKGYRAWGRLERVAVFNPGGSPHSVYVAPIEAWLAAYATWLDTAASGVEAPRISA